MIPEGTIVVAKWLCLQIEKISEFIISIQIFCNIPRFQNGPVDTWSTKKKQKFDQFGIETFGTKILAADVEIVENP